MKFMIILFNKEKNECLLFNKKDTGTYIKWTPLATLSNGLSEVFHVCDELVKHEKGLPRSLIEVLLMLGEPKSDGLTFPVCDELVKGENGFPGALTALLLEVGTPKENELCLEIWLPKAPNTEKRGR